MTTRSSILALAALSVMAIATTSASAAGFLAPHPTGVVVENCSGNPKLGCAVSIQPSSPGQVTEPCHFNPRLRCAVSTAPTQVSPVAMCPRASRFSVRIIRTSMPYSVGVATPIRTTWPVHIHPRHHVWY